MEENYGNHVVIPPIAAYLLDNVFLLRTIYFMLLGFSDGTMMKGKRPLRCQTSDELFGRSFSSDDYDWMMR